jgi:hypothetical protein
VRTGFDWKPLLNGGEIILWEGRLPHLKILAFGAGVTAMATAAWLLAMGDVAQAPGGAVCLSAECPTADRKAGFVVYFAGPVSILFGVFFVFFSAFIQQIGVVTSKRVLSITFWLWRRQPTLRQIPIKGARAMLNSAPLVTLGLIVSSPYSSRDLVLWARSRAELRKAESMIEKLSSGETPELSLAS